jgi:hypothetical protein
MFSDQLENSNIFQTLSHRLFQSCLSKRIIVIFVDVADRLAVNLLRFSNFNSQTSLFIMADVEMSNDNGVSGEPMEQQVCDINRGIL